MNTLTVYEHALLDGMLLSNWWETGQKNARKATYSIACKLMGEQYAEMIWRESIERWLMYWELPDQRGENFRQASPIAKDEVLERAKEIGLDYES